MSDTILADLQESIKKNLPAQVGDQLRKRLEEADELERSNGHLKKSNGDLIDEVIDVKNRLIEADKQVKAANLVLAREEKVAEDERNQKVHDSELKAKCAEEKAAQALELVKLVFKSPVYKSEVYRSKTHSPQCMPNGQYNIAETSNNESKTVIEE